VAELRPPYQQWTLLIRNNSSAKMSQPRPRLAFTSFAICLAEAMYFGMIRDARIAM